MIIFFTQYVQLVYIKNNTYYFIAYESLLTNSRFHDNKYNYIGIKCIKSLKLS